MYFCPNCSYLFDISKSSTILKTEDDRVILKKIPDLFKKIDDKEDLSKFKAEFSKEELGKNKRYQKLSDNEKIQVNQVFEDMIVSGAEFKCNNCNYKKQITETTLLYQIITQDKFIKIKNLDENKLLCHDPTYPHTHDYTCKNPNCETHKKPDLKDSIFIREKNSYKLNYICCVCYYNW